MTRSPLWMRTNCVALVEVGAASYRPSYGSPLRQRSLPPVATTVRTYYGDSGQVMASKHMHVTSTGPLNIPKRPKGMPW